MEGKRPVALAMRFLFVLQGDRSYYDMRLANNLHVREDKAATARKRGGKPKQHREFRRDYFRGGNAPASLKQHIGRRGVRGVRDFRGGNAPASLKRHAGVGDVSLHPQFPGWKRPGLIEASASASCRSRQSQFPGWKRPGLIEACTAQEVVDQFPWISGVETPRPH